MKILSLKLSQNDYAPEASLNYTYLSVVSVAFCKKKTKNKPTT